MKNFMALLIGCFIMLEPHSVFAAVAQNGSGLSETLDVDTLKASTWVPDNRASVTESGRQAISAYTFRTGSGHFHHIGTYEYWNGGYKNDFFIQYKNRAGADVYNSLGNAAVYMGQSVTYDIARWASDGTGSEWTYVIWHFTGSALFHNRFQTIGHSLTGGWALLDNLNTCTKQVVTAFQNLIYRQSNGTWGNIANNPNISPNTNYPCTNLKGYTSGSLPGQVSLWINE